MPDRLTFQATLVLVAFALGLAFGAAVLVGRGATAAKPTAKGGSALVQRAPGSEIDLGLTEAQAVPALRAPRKGRVGPRLPAPIATRPVTPAPSRSLVSAPVAPAESAQPTPTAAPQVTPAPKPKPEPIATPESAGNFDTTGEPLTEATNQIPDTSATEDGPAK